MENVVPIQPFVEPLVKSVTVARPVEEAFSVFTEGLGRWWPLHSHSISQERARTCAIEGRVGGAIYEVRDDGERCPWGHVLVWEPPSRVVLSWYPDRGRENGQEVEVSFTPAASGTRVQLTHRDWAKMGDRAAAMREAYADGWQTVFCTLFAEACGGAV